MREPKNRGRIYGKKKSEFICWLFSYQQFNRHTDEVLAKMIEKEYPKAIKNKIPWAERLPGLRNIYNRGEFKCQIEAPRRPCLRYTKSGEEAPNTRGPEPRAARKRRARS